MEEEILEPVQLLEAVLPLPGELEASPIVVLDLSDMKLSISIKIPPIAQRTEIRAIPVPSFAALKDACTEFVIPVHACRPFSVDASGFPRITYSSFLRRRCKCGKS